MMNIKSSAFGGCRMVDATFLLLFYLWENHTEVTFLACGGSTEIRNQQLVHIRNLFDQ